MANFILSAFADEYSSNFNEQLKVLNEQNITYIELRNVDGKSVIDLTLEEAKEYKKKLDEHKIRISAIGSPIGKSDIIESIDFEINRLKHAIKLAKIFDTKNIRMFSFYNRNNVEFDKFEKEVFFRLEKLLDIAEKEDIRLCHENESEIYGDILERCLKLYNHFNGRLRCVFDMANYVVNKVDALEAYLKTRQYIEYFHVKDAFYDGAIVPSGKGEGHIVEIFALANKDFNHDVLVTIEPHLSIFGGLNKLSKLTLRNTYTFPSQQEAFLEGVRSTKECLNKVKEL